MAEGITPLEFMLNVMRDVTNEPKDRLSAAVSAAPYIHPRLAAVEHSGPGGGPMQVERVELAIVDPAG